ncbi:hypothetical protein WKT07_08810 [Mediterraneibacter sp. HCN-7094]
MARNISKEILEQKIAKTEKAICKNREQYDRLTAELEELHKKQKAIQDEELLKAIEGSSKSYKKILDFIQGKAEVSSE